VKVLQIISSHCTVWVYDVFLATYWKLKVQRLFIFSIPLQYVTVIPIIIQNVNNGPTFMCSRAQIMADGVTEAY